MEFEAKSIDFLKTHKNFGEKYGGKTVSRKSFCAHIVRMAEVVITTYFDQESIKGVKKCFEYEIGRISWQNSVWIIPLYKTKLFFCPYSELDRKTISLLSDSLILTVLAYRIQLNETHSGLSNIVFNQIILGFERVCDWLDRGIEINPKNNELIEVFDIEHLKSFICK